MRTYDVLGVGFGPANIALAAAIREEMPRLSCHFLEAQPATDWQPDMLLPGSDIQHNPIRDLATLRNPRSRYSFINYLHEEGRLLSYLNLPAPFPVRREYARYVRWVGAHFADVVSYEARVVDIAAGGAPLPRYTVTTADGRTFAARSLVLGTGRTPYLPPLFAAALDERVFHSADYLTRKQALYDAGAPVRDIVVIGSSQSAAEIALDLHSAHPGTRVHCVMRGFGYRLKDTSPFSEEAFFPEFTDYYYRVGGAARAELDRQLRTTNYSCVDRDVIEQLYMRRYEDELRGEQRLILHNNREVVGLERVGEGAERRTLALAERHTGERSTITADAVVLATGYRNLGPAERDERLPRLLAPLADRLRTGDDGVVAVERDYAVSAATKPAEAGQLPPLFLNGLCENTHGLGDAGSFSLVSLRAATILGGLRDRLARHELAGAESRITSAFRERIAVLSPPRTGSTALVRVLWNHSRVTHHAHEPFETRYWGGGEGPDEAARVLLTPLELAGGQRVSPEGLAGLAGEPDSGPGLLVKDMTFQVDDEAFDVLARLTTRPLVFVMREPRACVVSRLRVVRELNGASTFAPRESGWDALNEQVQACRRRGVPYVIVDSDDMRAAPERMALLLCEALGLPAEPELTRWSPRPGLKLCPPGVGALMSPVREQDDPFYRRVLGSSGVEPVEERDVDAELEMVRAAGLANELEMWTKMYAELRADEHFLTAPSLVGD